MPTFLPSLHLSSHPRRGHKLVAWLFLGLFLLLWQATVAQAADNAAEAQELAAVMPPACTAVDWDHTDPADFEFLPVLHVVAQPRPAPHGIDIATPLQLRAVQPGLPPPRVVA
jgi:hypothetical protein